MSHGHKERLPSPPKTRAERIRGALRKSVYIVGGLHVFNELVLSSGLPNVSRTCTSEVGCIPATGEVSVPHLVTAVALGLATYGLARLLKEKNKHT
jgi:hypothetical protein